MFCLKQITSLALIITFVFCQTGFTSFVFAEEDVQKIEEPYEESNKKDAEQDDSKVLKGYISKIPSGTKIKIILETPIDEITSKIDDEITAKTSEDIVIDENIVVPVGSTVIGTISEITLAKRLHKAGNVRIEFKSLTMPDGRQVPIVASVLTKSGLVKGKYTKKTALISGATILGPAAAGFGAGLAAEGSAVGAGIGAIVGLLAGTALFAFQRGNMVDIKAGDEMNIELVEEAVVPKYEDAKLFDKEMLEESENKESENIETETEPAQVDPATEIDFTDKSEVENKKDELIPEEPENMQSEFLEELEEGD